MEATIWEWFGKGTAVVGGIVIILKIIFQFMLKWRDKKNGNGNNKIQAGTLSSAQFLQEFKQVYEWLKKLFQWHEPDDSGVQQWKNPSFARDIKSVEEELKNQTKIIVKICTAVESGAQQINEMHNKIMKL